MASIGVADEEPLSSALGLLALGVAIVSPDSEIIRMNRAAAAMLRDSLLFSATDSDLKRRVPGLAPARRFVNALSGPSDGKRWAATLLQAHSHRRIHLFVVPLESRAGAPATYVVFICDPQQRLAPSERLLRDLYQFTSAEARLACELMNGFTLDEAAERLKIKTNTARSHLKRIFAKTETKRQGDVVRLLTATFSALHLND